MLSESELKDSALSRMTAKRFTEGEVETDEFLIVTEKQLALDSHHLEPTGRSSELLLLTLRKLEENHELSSAKRVVEGGGRAELGLVGR